MPTAPRPDEAAARLHSVLTITDAALADLDLESLLRELLQRIRTETGTDESTILLLAPEDDELRVRASCGLESEVEEGVRIPVGQGLAGKVAQSGEAIIVDDVSAEPVASPALRDLSSMMLVPLRVEGAVIGVLHIGSRSRRRFSEGDLHLLTMVADRVSLALDRARALAEARAELAEHERSEVALWILAEASAVFSAQMDEEVTLRSLAGLAVGSVADFALSFVLEPDGTLVRVGVAHRDPEQESLLEEFAPAGPDTLAEAAARVIRTGEPLHVPLIDEEVLGRSAATREQLEALHSLRPRSAIIVPLSARGRILGAFCVLTRTGGRLPLQREDVSLVQDLGARAALAVDNARLFRRLETAERAARERAERLERLQELTAALSRSLTPAEVGEAAVTIGSAVFRADGGFFAVMDPEGDALEGVQTVGYPEAFAKSWQRVPLSLGTPITETVRTREPLFLRSRDERDARFPDVPGPEGFEALATEAFAADGRVLGAWTLHFREPREFDADDRAFFRTLTQLCTQALERARLYSRARSELIERRLTQRQLRKARDRAEEASRAKSQFLAVMSHELRTPLTAIIGYAELLESGVAGPVTDTQHEQLGRIRQSAWHLVEIINEILTFSRVEAGREPVRTEETDAARIATEAVTLVQPQASAAGLELVVDLPEQRVDLVTDPGKVRQILLNLLGNAVKFTERGQVGLAVRREPDGAIAFHVHDTGPGIASEHAETIFEPFRQVDQSNTRVKGGTGLGLPVSRELARLLGGDLTFQSTPGAGSTFTLRLPRQPGESSFDAGTTAGSAS